MAYSLIPITSKPNNTFSCKVPIEGKNLGLVFKTSFNEIAQYWTVSLSTTEGKELLSNVPLIPSENILEQYAFLGIGSAYILPIEIVSDEYPNQANLGDVWKLVWGDTV